MANREPAATQSCVYCVYNRDRWQIESFVPPRIALTQNFCCATLLVYCRHKAETLEDRIPFPLQEQTLKSTCCKTASVQIPTEHIPSLTCRDQGTILRHPSSNQTLLPPPIRLSLLGPHIYQISSSRLPTGLEV
ncbi:hypothetical protein PT974_06804 [Cladobotryum mycophilum]|uniref:Uncharacterized protein n=1 Tax=Cladobotryum mycophilum TaxID=491253 RepID=A0ABR0SMP1_9HYPO